jgi:SAM-dependent methyltransferase
MTDYVHGYTDTEATRLQDQAKTLAGILHHDTAYPAESRVLEVGCGVGAQTVVLAKNSPGARILSMDIDRASLDKARAAVAEAGFRNVAFHCANLFHLPFAPGSFDHVFLCFVLEHLPRPLEALKLLLPAIRKGGTITVIEGDHGSTFFHPRNAAAHLAIQCLIDLQADAGGDALIGRRLFPLLTEAGFRDVAVSPRMVYVDASRPELVQGFTLDTFTAMVAGVENNAIERGMIDSSTWKAGMAGLHRAAENDGVFCYTFFKATGRT